MELILNDAEIEALATVVDDYIHESCGVASHEIVVLQQALKKQKRTVKELLEEWDRPAQTMSTQEAAKALREALPAALPPQSTLQAEYYGILRDFQLESDLTVRDIVDRQDAALKAVSVERNNLQAERERLCQDIAEQRADYLAVLHKLDIPNNVFGSRSAITAAVESLSLELGRLRRDARELRNSLAAATTGIASARAEHRGVLDQLCAVFDMPAGTTFGEIKHHCQKYKSYFEESAILELWKKVTGYESPAAYEMRPIDSTVDELRAERDKLLEDCEDLRCKAARSHAAYTEEQRLLRGVVKARDEAKRERLTFLTAIADRIGVSGGSTVILSELDARLSAERAYERLLFEIWQHLNGTGETPTGIKAYETRIKELFDKLDVVHSGSADTTTCRVEVLVANMLKQVRKKQYLEALHYVKDLNGGLLGALSDTRKGGKT